MVELHLRGRTVNTVFDLLGETENDITFSVGWALAQSPSFLTALLKSVFGKNQAGTPQSINLQHHGKDGGYTDIEIVTDRAHLIAEAKRQWCLPGLPQLRRYETRLRRIPLKTMLLVISECGPEFAGINLPKAIRRIPVQHRSWRQIRDVARAACRKGRHAEKRLLREISKYLEGLMTMQKQDSNRVYVVSLGDYIPEWSKVSFIDFVEKKKSYWTPYDRTGPKEAPNYLGFRYGGRLQSIHHVEAYEITDDVPGHFPAIINRRKWNSSPGTTDTFMLYKLGPAIRPQRIVKAGKITRACRAWAALDLLLTSKTISDARDKSHRRFKEES